MRRSKYGIDQSAKGVEDRTADGIVFHSKREMLCYVNQFRPLMRSGIKVELQKPYPLYAARLEESPTGSLYEAVLICKYVADFVVTETNGTVRVYDAKGFSTPEFKLKMKIFAACYPHLRVVLI